MSDRVHKSMLNAEVNLLFFFLSLFLTFFSRKIFLDNLGADFMGLTGTLLNILGYLNLSELGISACIAYFLFKPIQTNNREEIQDILSLLGYLYNWIGTFIFVGAFIVSLFFPLIFAKAELSLGIIYFAFYSFWDRHSLAISSTTVRFFWVQTRRTTWWPSIISQPTW